MERTIEEIVEVFDDDKLKSYLEKDKSVEEILTGNIEELKQEKKKLSDKELELEKLESSYRDKLTHDVSTDELRNIADEIDKIKSEMSDITKNIEELESKLNNMIETKKQNEKTKEDYITIVSKTITDFEKKLQAIDNAIKVCDNEALKSAYEEEREKMQIELSNLKKKREEELDIAILNSNSDKTLLNDSKVQKNIELHSLKENEEIEVPEHDESVENVIEKLKQEVNTENLSPAFDEVNVSNILLPEQEITPNIDLSKDTIDIASIISENNIKGKLVKDNNFVPAEQVGDIFRSSSIMPIVFEKLDSYIDKGEVM